MVKMTTVDTKKIDHLLFQLRKKGPKIANKVIDSYTRSLAFNTKKNSDKTIARQFSFSNSSTKRFTQRGVMFKKTGGTKGSQEWTVGATGDEGGNTHKARKASYLARQELGGVVTQVKTRGGQRRQLIAPNPKFLKKRKMMRLAGKTAQAKKGLNNRKAVASAIRNARNQKKKFATTPFGIYRVLKKSARLIYTFKERGSIRTSANPWLRPATKMTLKKSDRILKQRMAREFRKIKT